MYQEAHVHLNMSKEKYDELKKEVPLNYYEGMYPNMKDGQVIIDDCQPPRGRRARSKRSNPTSSSRASGTSTSSTRWALPQNSSTAYDYSGPYAGYNGAMNFARDVANALTTPAWKLITPPWEKPENARRK